MKSGSVPELPNLKEFKKSVFVYYYLKVISVSVKVTYSLKLLVFGSLHLHKHSTVLFSLVTHF